MANPSYWVATSSRLLKIIGLLYKRALQKRLIFCKETYNFKEPTNRSHRIASYNSKEPTTPKFLLQKSPTKETYIL